MEVHMLTRPLSYQLLFATLLTILVLPITAWAEPGSVASSPKTICPLLLGSPVPEIPVQTMQSKPFDLVAAIKEKPTILIYFRGGW
jgi:hypothetical protein